MSLVGAIVKRVRKKTLKRKREPIDPGRLWTPPVLGWEHQIQSDYFKWVRYRLDHPAKHMIFAITNGAIISPEMAKYFWDEGMLPGAWDVIVAYPDYLDQFCGMFLESKAGRNDLSEAQVEFRTHALNAGFRCDVCWSTDELINATKEHLGL